MSGFLNINSLTDISNNKLDSLSIYYIKGIGRGIEENVNSAFKEFIEGGVEIFSEEKRGNLNDSAGG